MLQRAIFYSLLQNNHHRECTGSAEESRDHRSGSESRKCARGHTKRNDGDTANGKHSNRCDQKGPNFCGKQWRTAGPDVPQMRRKPD